MTLSNSKELGLNYLVDGKDVRGGGGGGGFQVVKPATDTVFPAFAPGSLAASGLRVYGQIGDLSAYIRALSSKTDFTVLSRPSIFTSNNQKGVISSGEKIAIPTEGGTSSGNYSSGTRIQYQDVVLKLEVIPLVNSNNEITMQIALLNDEQNGTQDIDGAGTGGGKLTVPKISHREILTTATVPNNKTIVLGGLIVGKKGKERSGIPFLSDIPIVGALFGSNSKSRDRSELMVFIQPSIISGDDSLNATQDDMNHRYDVSGGAREFAVGDSGLFGMPDTLPIPNKEADAAAAAAAAKKPVAKSKLGGIHRR
jgi:type II secretory pathway component GspD/PulD (secretin)